MMKYKCNSSSENCLLTQFLELARYIYLMFKCDFINNKAIIFLPQLWNISIKCTAFVIIFSLDISQIPSDCKKYLHSALQ